MVNLLYPLPPPLPQVVYYIFAMVGMELFKGKIQFFEDVSVDPARAYCGNPLLKGTAFAQLNYCKNNFNNVVSSFILLLELTVVNQWHDILWVETSFSYHLYKIMTTILKKRKEKASQVHCDVEVRSIFKKAVLKSIK